MKMARQVPFKTVYVHGLVRDSNGQKMSKSKGNVVTPMGLLEKHSADAVRYWAASARLGTDAAFEENQMKIGRRLAIKILNASKFALTMGGDEVSLDASAITKPIDRAMIAKLREVIADATRAMEGYDHTRALELTETAFWSFCDDYLELVKDRAYNRDDKFDASETDSARAALAISVDVFIRLFAPFLPYACEEVWSWYQSGSVHQASWPTGEGLENIEADSDLLGVAGRALAVLRKVKSENKVSQRTTYVSVGMMVPQADQAYIADVIDDLRQAAHVEGTFDVLEGDSICVASYELETPTT